MGLEFSGSFNRGHDRGGPDTILTRPDCRSLKRIVGDGNCLFRSLCYIITGSEEQHFALHTVIVQHMLSIPLMFVGYKTDEQPNCISLSCHPHCYESVEEYVQQTRMDSDKVRGTNVEMVCLAHILRAPVYCYDAIVNVIKYGQLIFPTVLTDRFLEMFSTDLFIYTLLIITLKLLILFETVEFSPLCAHILLWMQLHISIKFHDQ